MSTLDQKKTEKFTGKMISILNHSLLGLMMSIGNRTELFQILSQNSPSSIKKISELAGLNERYVREWLNAMVVGGILEYDVHNSLYNLPKEHAVVITEQAAYRNLALIAEWIQPLAMVEDLIIDCFKNGGGVSYEHYSRFMPLLARTTELKYSNILIDRILPLVPQLDGMMAKGIDVLDVGCGFGDSSLIMARKYPKSIIKGMDISEKAIMAAKKKAKSLKNVSFEVGNAELLAGSKKYQLITAFDIIHDSAFPDRILNGISQSLDDEGIFLMIDIKASSHVENNMDHPLAPFLYSISTLHCMTVSLSNGGMGLGTVWGKELAVEMLKNAGFSQIEIKELEEDPFNYYYIAQN